MTTRVLKTDVHIGMDSFKAGTAESDLPEGVEIPNPKAWIEVPDAVEEPVSDRPPRRAGSGSARGLWVQYAAAKDVEIDPGYSREEIIRALEAAGVPTE